MSAPSDLLSLVVTTLQTWSLCSKVRVLEIRQFSESQFTLKVRAELATGGILQVRLYRNGEHTDYAYNLIHDDQVVRWDNKEHFTTLPSHPHHFHIASGQVKASSLTGNPSHDLPLVLDYLTTNEGLNRADAK